MRKFAGESEHNLEQRSKAVSVFKTNCADKWRSHSVEDMTAFKNKKSNQRRQIQKCDQDLSRQQMKVCEYRKKKRKKWGKHEKNKRFANVHIEWLSGKTATWSQASIDMCVPSVREWRLFGTLEQKGLRGALRQENTHDHRKVDQKTVDRWSCKKIVKKKNEEPSLKAQKCGIRTNSDQATKRQTLTQKLLNEKEDEDHCGQRKENQPDKCEEEKFPPKFSFTQEPDEIRLARVTLKHLLVDFIWKRH